MIKGLIAAAVGAALMGPPALMVLTAMNSATTLADADTVSCTVTLGGSSAPTKLTAPDQQANAATIIKVGLALHVPTKGLIVSIATAMQESTLHNLTGGDRDSVGLFQQRNAWGTFEQRHDPAQAARMFFTGGHDGQPGLLDITGWARMSVTQAAQAVQRSAFPNAYARWEPLATRVVTQVAGGATTDCTQSTVTAGKWTLPVPGAPRTSPFGRRFHPILHIWRLHAGQDFGVPIGTPVHAAAAGKVTIAGPASGYGVLLEIDHGKVGPNGQDVRTRYGHLSHVDVRAGQSVQVGQIVARSGNTGESTGPHLHFEVRLAGVPIDPIPWLRSKGLKP